MFLSDYRIYTREISSVFLCTCKVALLLGLMILYYNNCRQNGHNRARHNRCECVVCLFYMFYDIKQSISVGSDIHLMRIETFWCRVIDGNSHGVLHARTCLWVSDLQSFQLRYSEIALQKYRPIFKIIFSFFTQKNDPHLYS